MRRYAVPALVLLAALGAAGCDSDDDDDDRGDGGSMTDGGDTDVEGGTPPDGMTGGGGDGAFAEILGRGPTDEPVDFDAAALAADLEGRFGGGADEPTDADDLAAGRRRAGH